MLVYPQKSNLYTAKTQVHSPGAELAEPGRVVDEEERPAVGREGKVHVVYGRLEVAEIAVLGQR